MDHTERSPAEADPVGHAADAGTEEQVVEVYWRPGCMFCVALRRGLRRRGIPVVERNIWDDPDAAEFVRSVAGGNETVPTVVVAGHWMVNPTAGQVKSLLIEHAPEMLERAGEPEPGGGGLLRRLFSGG